MFRGNFIDTKLSNERPAVDFELLRLPGVATEFELWLSEDLYWYSRLGLVVESDVIQAITA